MRRHRIILPCVSIALSVASIVWSLRSWGMPDQVTWASRGTFWRVRSEQGHVSILRADHWPGRERTSWSTGPDHVRDRTPLLDLENSQLHPPVRPTWSAGVLWGTEATTTVIVDEGSVRRWGDFLFLRPPPGVVRRVGYHELCVSWWLPALAFGLPPGWWLGRRIFRSARSGLRRDRRLCPACGYSLRGTPTHCPECGWRADAEPRPSWLLDDG